MDRILLFSNPRPVERVKKEENKSFIGCQVWFDERRIELCGVVVEADALQVKIKMPFTGNIYTRRITQIRSNSRRK